MFIDGKVATVFDRHGRSYLLLLPILLSLYGRSFAEPPAKETPPQKPLDLQTRGGYLYGRPGPIDFITHIPSNQVLFFKDTFRRQNTVPILIVVGSTALLIWKDQEIVDEAQRFGSRNGISQNSDQSSRHGIQIGSQKLEIGLPSNTGEAMYFLGDGWLHFGIAAGFLGTGLIARDNRALQTSSQIVEAIFSSGLIVQVVKHVTGRESPFTTDTPGGVWRFFPNQFDYHQNVARYDAMPSGHLAAATATSTVIILNYPEYPVLKPICYGLLGALSYQMLNNGVHWAGDYPLAIALGYSFGKIAVNRGRTKKQNEDEVAVYWEPRIIAGGGGLQLTYRF